MVYNSTYPITLIMFPILFLKERYFSIIIYTQWFECINIKSIFGYFFKKKSHDDNTSASQPASAASSPVASTAATKQSWLDKLRSGLTRTSSGISTLFTGTRIDDDLYDELESALLMSDAGVEATHELLDALKKRVRTDAITDVLQVKAVLRELMMALLSPLEKSLSLGQHHPLVVMIAGVNGAGKTTTIGKLAKHLQTHNQKVLLAAGDTFRAAAREQLTAWGERNQVAVIAQDSGDAAAVAHDAVKAGLARQMGLVVIDTAGRLSTQTNLMDELKKVKRVITKALDTAPHETILVIDGNTGQNGLNQVKAFHEALQLSAIIVTKLDGTAKGGVLFNIASRSHVPIRFIGVGEKIDDLRPFVAKEFVAALFQTE